MTGPFTSNEMVLEVITLEASARVGSEAKGKEQKDVKLLNQEAAESPLNVCRTAIHQMCTSMY